MATVPVAGPLRRFSDGDQQAEAGLLPRVYRELRRIARTPNGQPEPAVESGIPLKTYKLAA